MAALECLRRDVTGSKDMLGQTHQQTKGSLCAWPTRSQIKQNLRPPRGVAAVFGDEVLREQTLTVVAPIWPNESN